MRTASTQKLEVDSEVVEVDSEEVVDGEEEDWERAAGLEAAVLVVADLEAAGLAEGERCWLPRTS